MVGKELVIIVPVYKDGESLKGFAENIIKKSYLINLEWKVVFIIDPYENDDTVAIAKSYNNLDNRFQFIIMSRRFGQAVAIQVGLIEVIADVYIIMDVDGQDPLEVVPDLIRFWNDGFKIVLPKRTTRQGESSLRKILTSIGYEILNRYSVSKIPKYVGDFRLIDKEIRDTLIKIDDPYYFLRGNVAQIGFPYKEVAFERNSRRLGQTKYNKYFGSIVMAINAIVGYTSIVYNLMILITIINILILVLFIFDLFINFLISPFKLFLLTFLVFNLGIIISNILFYIIRIHDYHFKKPRYQILQKSNKI